MKIKVDKKLPDYTDIQNAIKWFRSKGIIASVHDGNVIIAVNQYDVMISNEEILYRSTMYQREL